MRRTTAVLLGIAALIAVLWPGRLIAQNVFEKLVMPGPLAEGHAKLESDCKNCHAPFSKEQQRGLCLACHKEIAADLAKSTGYHGKREEIRNRECAHCHSEHKGRGADLVQLERATFVHGQTNFELKGGHQAAACEGCHAAKVKFRKAPHLCFDCHKAAEPHKGRLGDKCEACHSELGWRAVAPFDHSKTRFPLLGAHKEVACAICHLGEHYKNLNAQCGSCHRIDDAHAGRYGAKCETCHAPQKWQTVRFDHDKLTKFPLRGEHTKVKCDACHKGDLYRDKLATQCVACHQKDEPHKGQLGTRCEQCHKETGWRQAIAFDHDLTRFPLVGRHAQVGCDQCHRTKTFKDTPRACASCHKDTLHEGRLGPNCNTCHNPNGWAVWRFDHNRQTKFALTGAHAGLNCHACHKSKVTDRITQASDCYSCHAQDDAHHGAFGKACEKCHTTTSFKVGTFGR